MTARRQGAEARAANEGGDGLPDESFSVSINDASAGQDLSASGEAPRPEWSDALAPPPVRTRRFPVRALVIFGVLAAAVAGVATLALQPAAMTVVQVARGTAVEAVYANGAVEPRAIVEVKARAAGVLAGPLVERGDDVREGQLLGRIEVPAAAMELQRGRIDLNAAMVRASSAPQTAALGASARVLQARLEQARLDVNRIRELGRSGTGTAADLERAQLAATELEGQLAANIAQQRDMRMTASTDLRRERAAIASLELHASETEIHAPMNGAVLTRRVEPGDLVAIHQPLFQIGDVQHLLIRARVDESDVPRLHVGMRAFVRLSAFRDQVFQAELNAIAPAAAPDRHDFEVTLRFLELPAGVRAGMTAEVNLVVHQSDGTVLAPVEAVRDGQVWILSGDGRVHRRTVAVGLRDLTQVEITSGLRVGDVIASLNDDSLREGMRVRPVPAPPPRRDRTRP